MDHFVTLHTSTLMLSKNENSGLVMWWSISGKIPVTLVNVKSLLKYGHAFSAVCRHDLCWHYSLHFGFRPFFVFVPNVVNCIVHKPPTWTLNFTQHNFTTAPSTILRNWSHQLSSSSCCLYLPLHPRPNSKPQAHSYIPNDTRWQSPEGKWPPLQSQMLQYCKILVHDHKSSKSPPAHNWISHNSFTY